MSLRVVAGTARGRKLEVPPGQATRPTSDRAREAIFNALASLGALDGANVLDLFAGSGALAIEALSRGAESATLVESDRAVRGVIERNLSVADLADDATLVPGDGLAYLARSSERFDLVLLDPPYAFAEWAGLLAALVPRLADDAIVVLESDRPVEPVAPLTVIREKRYGGTVVRFTQVHLGAATHAGDNE